jgi:hypothetical protein
MTDTCLLLMSEGKKQENPETAKQEQKDKNLIDKFKRYKNSI